MELFDRQRLRSGGPIIGKALAQSRMVEGCQNSLACFVQKLAYLVASREIQAPIDELGFERERGRASHLVANELILCMSDDPGRDLVIFTEALRLPAEERAAFLARACAGDENLRRKVEALLRAHGRVGDFLEMPPVETGTDGEIDKGPLDTGNNNGSSSDK